MPQAPTRVSETSGRPRSHSKTARTSAISFGPSTVMRPPLAPWPRASTLSTAYSSPMKPAAVAIESAVERVWLRPCMTTIPGQPPAGGAADGRCSVAASAVPSAEAIVTSCLVEACAGAASASAAAAAAIQTLTTRARGYRAAPLPTITRMDGRPIGVFDSGMGGLTVLHECLVTLPHEDFVYLGDGARLPYGPRPLEEIRRFAGEIAGYLERQGVKLIVAACNSATAAALPDLQRRLSVPVIGVLAPEAHAAVLATRNRRIGLLATEATVARRRYAELVHALDAGVELVPVACPRLVPLIEGEDPFGEETTAAVRAYAT